MSAEATVTDIINDARGFASSSYDDASDLISSAQSAAQSSVQITPRNLNFDAPTPSDIDESDSPGAFEDGFAVPSGKPNAPTSEFETLYKPVLPTFPDAPDELNTEGLFDIDRPQFNVGEFTGGAPQVDTNLTTPPVPEIQSYEAPETTDLQLRDTPLINTTPQFDPNVTITDVGNVPDPLATYRARLQAAVPEFRDWVETYSDAWLTTYAPEYHTAMAQLETRIADGYDGNTAMPEAVEQQIFDRGVARAEAQRADLDEEAAERFSRRGYSLPPIALNTQLAANHQTVARAAAGVARDVAIERAKMEHEHVQFVMQLSSTLRDGMRGQVLQYAGLLVNVNSQALQEAAQVAGVMVDAHKLLQSNAQLDLEHLRTLAQVYETEMKSAMADLEIFKVEMEAAKTRKDAELADVDVWARKIDAEQTKINLYIAQLRGLTEQVNVEKLKVDVFGAEVDAYTSLVRAKESEFNAYRSAIAGDEALVKAHSEKVRAYAAEVDAARVKVQAESAITDAGVQWNRNLIDVFQAELEAWTKELDAEGTRFEGSAAAYRTRLDFYKTRINTQLEQERNRYEAASLDLRAQIAENQSDVRTLLAQAELLQERIKTIATTAMAGAEAYGAMASSAVSAQNTMVNLVNETLNGG